MKKILCVLTAILMIFTLTSCATVIENIDIYQTYVKASEAMNNADSVELEVDMLVNMTFGDESADIKLSGDVRKVVRSETDADVDMNLTMSATWMDMSVRTFYTNGTAYMQTMGMKVKVPISTEEIMARSYTKTIEFPEIAVKEKNINKGEDGTELSFTLDSSFLRDILLEQLSGIDEELSETMPFEFGDVTLTAVIDKDDMFKSFSITYSIEGEADGAFMRVESTMEIRVIQIGGVTIEFPDDLDEYMEMPF